MLTAPNQTTNTWGHSRASETAGAKLRRREGNNPDHQLRSLSADQVGKVVDRPRQPGGWLRSSHPSKSA